MKHKKLLLLLIPVAAVAAIGIVLAKNSNKEPQAMPVEYTTLEKKDLSSTVNTSGRVQSASEVNVYSNLSYAVKDIMVNVGDRVKEGDILCTLDSESLQDEIQKTQASITDANRSAQQEIKNNQKKYDDEREILEAGLNVTLNQAQQRVLAAKIALDHAKQKLSDAQNTMDSEMNANLVAAQDEYNQAQSALGRAESALRDRRNELGSSYSRLFKDYEKALKDYEKAVKKKSDDEDELKELVLSLTDQLTRAENEADELYNYNSGTSLSIKQLRQNVTDAQRAFDSAEKKLAIAQQNAGQDITEYQKAIDSAQIDYDNAVQEEKAARASVNQDLEDSLLNLQDSKTNATTKTTLDKLELQSMRNKLSQCTVVAPASGTITAIYAKEGAAPSGILFIIEDTNALEIVVKIKEYDVNTVQTGMPAVIRSDATGEDTYDGYLKQVAPAAVKQLSGDSDNGNTQTAATGNAEYESTVSITSKDTRLRIGMNAKADIIVEKRENVFAVPFEAVAVNAEGKDIVYTVDGKADGTAVIREVPITMGLETDYEVEISGEGLTAGMQLIAEAKQVMSGMTVMAPPAEVPAAGGGSAPAEGEDGQSASSAAESGANDGQ